MNPNKKHVSSILQIRSIQRQKALDLQRAWHSIPEVRKRQLELAKMRKYKLKIKLLNRLGGKCVCCGVGMEQWWNLTFDHIKPQLIKIKGDNYTSDWWQSLIHIVDLSPFQILCFGCNSSKGKREECTLPHGGKLL